MTHNAWLKLIVSRIGPNWRCWSGIWDMTTSLCVPRNPFTGRVSRKYDGLWLPFNKGRVRNLNWKNCFSAGTTFWNTTTPNAFQKPTSSEGPHCSQRVSSNWPGHFECSKSGNKIVVGGQHYFPAFITTNIFKSIYSCTVSVFNLTATCLLFYSGNDLTRTRTSHYGNLKADTQRPRACAFSQQVGVYWTWSFFWNQQELIDYLSAISKSC